MVYFIAQLSSIILAEINNLKDLLWDMVKTMKNTNDLDSEAALLSRFLYCYKRLFRHEKGMHNLTKASRFLIGVERTVVQTSKVEKLIVMYKYFSTTY